MKYSLRVLAVVAMLGWVAPAGGGQWNGGGLLGTVNFDTQAAGSEGVDDSALSFGGYAEYQSDGLINLSMGGEFLLYDDHAEFSQLVEYEYSFGNDSDLEVETSDALAMHFFMEAGPRWRFGSGYTTIAAGFNSVLYSERTISNCTNCLSEDIDLDGGGYAKFAVGADTGAVNIGLLYRAFFSGDLENALYLTVGTSF